MKMDVLNWKKEKKDSVDLDPFIFDQKVRLDIISEVVRWQRACKRKGTHNVKTRGDVRGGGIKPFRQKGTGRARQGSIRSPLLVGGGVAHGPHPRSYATRIPSKLRKLGMRSCLSYKVSQKSVYIVEDMISKEGKTKELQTRFKNFGLDSGSLLVDKSKDVQFDRACRNLAHYQFIPVKGVNILDLLKHKKIVFTKKGIEELSQVYGRKKS